MSGTDSSRRPSATVSGEGGAPVIILVEPQLGENIGAAARAMLNFGLPEMRLVKPRDVWPNHKAINTSSGAQSILEAARLYDRLEVAIADLHHVYASTARPRDMAKPAYTPRQAAGRLRAEIAGGKRCGILFGGERAGLENDDVALAEAILMVPANPAFASINLAQAVLLVGYEWFQAGNEAVLPDLPERRSELATQDSLHHFFEHLEAELDACGFLHPPEKRPNMVRNLRNIFTRAGLTDQEVRTLRGVVKGLAEPRRRGSGSV
jgi:tRNA/rRNA methyltransferase